MAWKARLLMGLMLVVVLLATAGPAMAQNDRQERREERREFREELREDFFFVDHDIDFVVEDDFDDDDVEFVDFGFVPFFFAVEEIDIDCDGFDDDFDGLFDEGADCEIEFEFFDFD